MTVARDEQFRVTSIQHNHPRLLIFSGVPLAKDSHRTSSVKYFVTVKADPDTLPVAPSVGQHWQISGPWVFNEQENNGYVMKQHLYESPEYAECTLPEYGEQLIQFIAKEKDFRGIGESKARALWSALGKSFHKTLQLALKSTENASETF